MCTPVFEPQGSAGTRNPTKTLETTSAGLESSSQKTCLLHFSLGGAWRVLEGFHFAFAHGVIGVIVVEDHGSLVGALIGLVASTSACEAFDGTCLDGLISWGR